MRGCLLGVGLLLASGCADDATLVVSVRTDLHPGRELASVEVVIAPRGGGVERTFTVDATESRDWGRGVRVAETRVPAGSWSARVSARDASGALVAARPVRVEVAGGGVRAVTVWLTRDCLGVVCPLAGDAPALVACLAGRCVEDGCTEESPEACGPPACASRDDCGPAPAGACAARECTPSGACVDVLDHAACGEEEVCSATLGCAAATPTLSPPSLGHVHVVALTPGYHVHRVELRAGAPTEDVSAALEARLPSMNDHADDTSAGLSANGEWLSMVVRRGGCVECLLVAPVRDLSAAELLADVVASPFGGTAITNDGATVVYQGAAVGGLFAVRRGPGGWAPDPVALTARSPYRDHRDPSLTPDGARIVFECNDGDREAAGLCAVGLDGEGFVVRLPLDVVGRGSPGIPRETADGGLLFHARWSGVPELYRLPPGGSSPEPAFSSGDNDWSYPCVLPDGGVVVPEFGNRIHLLGPDGSPTLSLDIVLPPERSSLYLDACGL